MPVKIVIDTNIQVSYFISARTDYLIQWIANNEVEVFTSAELIEELENVLLRPKFKLPFPSNAFVELHKKVCTQIKINPRYIDAPDKDDNFLFDICLKAKAAFLITADKQLLQHKPSFLLEITSFNEIRNKISRL